MDFVFHANDYRSLVHEICHAVQFEDFERTKHGFFLFKLPRQRNFFGAEVYNPAKNCDATIRELEVFAMQSLFCRDYHSFKKDSIEAMANLYDYQNVVGGKKEMNKLWTAFAKKWNKEKIMEKFLIWLDAQYVNRRFRKAVGK